MRNYGLLWAFMLDEPLSRNGRYFSPNQLGSTTTLTDGAETVAQSYLYGPFGAMMASTGEANPIQYAGHESDGTGLYFDRARNDVPERGWHLSTDPIGFAGGPNRYRLKVLEITQIMTPPRSIVSLTVRNVRAAEIAFHLEPWGEEYTMPPGAAFQIVARGPAGQSLELEVGDDYLIVYGWPGSVVALFREGAELGGGHGERPPVPPTPPSMSVSTFIRTVFGSPDEPPTPLAGDES